MCARSWSAIITTSPNINNNNIAYVMKQKTMIQFPGSEKIHIAGQINKVEVGMRRIALRESQLRTLDGKTLSKPNSPLVVYDTTGAYSDPQYAELIANGLPRLRESWYAKRKDIRRDDEGYRAKPGKAVSQLYYAKRRIITPEMEYVAIRENQQIEMLGLKSYITPEFVRKEVAAGRAVIPANVNHSELEPMIIGQRFLVKVSNAIDSYDFGRQPANEQQISLLDYLEMGCDVLTLPFEQEGFERREGGDAMRKQLLRHSPIPVAADPLSAAYGKAESIDWPTVRQQLIRYCQEGIDILRLCPTLTPAISARLRQRMLRSDSNEHRFWEAWFASHPGEDNFLNAHFAEICEILRTYDVTLCLGDATRATSIYDATADSLRKAELTHIRELVDQTRAQQVQVIVENAGHSTMDKVQESMKELRYMGHEAPVLTIGPLQTNAAFGFEALSLAMGGASAAWQGASLLSCAPITALRHQLKPADKKHTLYRALLMAKVAAHSADVAKAHPGAALRDHAICKALADPDRGEAEAELLSLVPRRFRKWL